MEKLVRDRIPEIMSADGDHKPARAVWGKELDGFLAKKLVEEAREFEADPSLEELADLFEVAYAILEHRGWTMQELTSIRLTKKTERGAFRRGMVVTFPDDK